MGNVSIMVHMFMAFFWLRCLTTASHDHRDTGACHGQQHGHSGSEKNCQSGFVPNDDFKYDAQINDEREKRKYLTMHNEDELFRGVYSFPVEPIPRRNCFDEEAMQFLHDGLPVVLENCTFHKSALKWTVEYLEENLQDEDHTAYISDNRKFLYYDDDRIKGAYKDFKPPTKQRLLRFSNFTKLIKELERANNGSRAYFQSLLVLQDGLSSSMLDDIDSFNYTWLLHLVKRMQWGDEVTNLLLVGMHDVVTPAHYDVLENLYVQIVGRKRVILFSPDYFRSLYPFPVGHPHDRQSQVDFDNPDLDRFPRFSEIGGMEVAMKPGEVLYIPNYWWHYIESEMHSNTISVNFWFDPKNATTNNGVQDPEKSENNSAEALVEKSLENDKPHQDNQSPVAGSEQTTGEDLRDAGDDKQPKEHNDEVKKDQVKDDISEKEKKAETEGEKKATQEEEEGEIELSAAQYLALLRETESLLYQATLNHEKVKKMLDELLNGRFNNLY